MPELGVGGRRGFPTFSTPSLGGRTRLHVSPHPLDYMPSFCFEVWGKQPSHQPVDLREAATSLATVYVPMGPMRWSQRHMLKS